ncbi:hypothetical protein H2199_005070 [Coniosporium tulheliwenetii]|uniref:Uncharacterized protein n=1 Tax=Coniosporium tulheliwenetii TaxID=3383036 RepID=A0ACC2Z2A3_9PEZI|nr:hypothetical protein H2199_005070 [Cladosporium sp. JES 115]
MNSTRSLFFALIGLLCRPMIDIIDLTGDSDDSGSELSAALSSRPLQLPLVQARKPLSNLAKNPTIAPKQTPASVAHVGPKTAVRNPSSTNARTAQSVDTPTSNGIHDKPRTKYADKASRWAAEHDLIKQLASDRPRHNAPVNGVQRRLDNYAQAVPSQMLSASASSRSPEENNGTSINVSGGAKPHEETQGGEEHRSGAEAARKRNRDGTFKNNPAPSNQPSSESSVENVVAQALVAPSVSWEIDGRAVTSVAANQVPVRRTSVLTPVNQRNDRMLDNSVVSEQSGGQHTSLAYTGLTDAMEILESNGASAAPTHDSPRTSILSPPPPATITGTSGAKFSDEEDRLLIHLKEPLLKEALSTASPVSRRARESEESTIDQSFESTAFESTTSTSPADSGTLFDLRPARFAPPLKANPLAPSPPRHSVEVPPKEPLPYQQIDRATRGVSQNGLQPRSTTTVPKPYLSRAQRHILRQGLEEGEWCRTRMDAWEGTILHADFLDEELAVLEKVIEDVLGTVVYQQGDTAILRIRTSMASATEADVYAISWRARRVLEARTLESIKQFLQDAIDGNVTSVPHCQKLGATAKHRTHSSSTSALLRRRELGVSSGRQYQSGLRNVPTALKNNCYDTLGPSISFTGTSGDVGTVAWAPDGQGFAAGSACLDDGHSMQYNRPNNLLIGDVDRKIICELPDHHVNRTRQETGANSSHSMHMSQDPRLFKTVSTVAFSPNGQYLYSAGYDNFVREWDLAREGESRSRDPLLASRSYGFEHKAPVELLTVNGNGLLATGCRRAKNSVKIIHPRDGVRRSFTSQRATERPESRIFPSCLRWGVLPFYSSYLLAGFCSNSEDEGKDGEFCMWNVEAKEPIKIWGTSGNVFDCAWSPHWNGPGGHFAVGTVAGLGVNPGTRSVVRTFDWRLHQITHVGQFSKTIEFECPARDMNDVVYNPYDDHYIIAGCTDGTTYVWDVRNDNRILHTLSHGDSLMALDPSQPRELLDTGIRFCSWAQDRTRLHTGSSDGVVKSWDIYRSSEDVHVQDVVTLNSCVMSGAFSPDYTRLLIGEENGSINVLEVGNDDRSLKEADSFTLHESPESKAANPSAKPADEASGIEAAKTLLEAQQITLRTMGGLPIRQAVQGPNYLRSGYLDTAADAPALRQAAQALQDSFRLPSDAEQCQLEACRDSSVVFTSEESGDSKRSQDRIPDALRSNQAGTSGAQLVAGKTKCAECGAPARPRLDGRGGDDSQPTTLCERAIHKPFHADNLSVYDNDIYSHLNGIFGFFIDLGSILIHADFPIPNHKLYVLLNSYNQRQPVFIQRCEGSNTSAASDVPETDDSWTSTYTYYEYPIPTFTTTSPPSNGIPTSVPAAKCFIDPSNRGAKFEVMDTRGYLIVNNGGYMGLLANAPKETTVYPPYHFEKPSPGGYFDLVFEDPAGPLYVAVFNNGSVKFSGTSSEGQSPKPAEDGTTFTTTLFRHLGLTFHNHYNSPTAKGRFSGCAEEKKQVQ